MGKDGGGVTDWHKQQHKKQLIKNKEARIAARDERVVQEKTVSDIQDEIKKLKKQFKNEEQRPHHIQSKLDRLHKELKLVTAKEEEDKQQHVVRLQQQKDAQKYESKDKYIPLDRPEVSIYFDPVMNPYGAPPPGQPRLYYRRGGGTTTNLSESCSPQEQFLPPPPQPPPPPPPRQSTQPIMNDRTDNPSPYRQDSYRKSNQPKIVSRTNKISSNNAANEEGIPCPLNKKVVSVDPTQLPDLPKPSAAVIRSKSNKLTSDIWASEEEIAYEENVSSISLEGVATALSISHNIWYYKDMLGSIQGPYSSEQMQQWNQAGYFPLTTLVSGSNSTGHWRPLNDFKQLKTHRNSIAPNMDKVPKDMSLTSIQHRIAALREDQLLEKEIDDEKAPLGDIAVNDSLSVQSRIAAIKANHQSYELVRDDVQKRIAALKAHQTVASIDHKVSEAIEHISVDRTDESISEQIRNVPSENQHDVVAVHRSEEFHGCDKNPSLPLPPAPLKGAMSLEDVYHYSIDHDVAPYPIDQDVNSEENWGSEDVNRQYHDSEEAEHEILINTMDDSDIPVTGDYSHEVEEFQLRGSEANESDIYDNADFKKPKKRVKVDNAIVALVPASIRKR
jgi:hypothetical protein